MYPTLSSNAFIFQFVVYVLLLMYIHSSAKFVPLWSKITTLNYTHLKKKTGGFDFHSSLKRYNTKKVSIVCTRYWPVLKMLWYLKKYVLNSNFNLMLIFTENPLFILHFWREVPEVNIDFHNFYSIFID